MKTIVAVDGIDGSGKSTFAKSLRTRLSGIGHAATIVSVDDFRRPIAWSSLVVPEVDAYYDAYYDLELAERTLRAFVAGEPRATIPRYDSVIEHINGTRELEFVGVDIAIVEGVFPLRIPAVADGILIYLDTTAVEARRRIVARDQHKGRTREEIERRIDRRYGPAQQRYHTAFSPRGHADVIVDNETPVVPVIVRRDLSRAPAALRDVLDRVLPR